MELCDRYGLDTVQHSITALMDYGERMTRQQLARIPDGMYRRRRLYRRRRFRQRAAEHVRQGDRHR